MTMRNILVTPLILIRIIVFAIVWISGVIHILSGELLGKIPGWEQ